ncbi:NUDIX hydrolase [Carnobacterium sp. TMP28]|uniref:NUDIX hydrolase n=1 Tax=Carnobacterium sp. TMP28 TaxID=3397060 RepID=UPI0039E017D0
MNLKEQVTQYKPYNAQEVVDQKEILYYLTTFDNLLTRENEQAHFTASAWVVNKKRTKVLMAYHNIYQSWSWVGGHTDGDADLLHVAFKETQEETGLKNLTAISNAIYSIEILEVPAHIKKDKPIAKHLHLNLTYLIEADEDELTSIKPDENSGVEWMELDEAVKACSEAEMKVVYEKLNQKLKQYKKD